MIESSCCPLMNVIQFLKDMMYYISYRFEIFHLFSVTECMLAENVREFNAL